MRRLKRLLELLIARVFQLQIESQNETCNNGISNLGRFRLSFLEIWFHQLGLDNSRRFLVHLNYQLIITDTFVNKKLSKTTVDNPRYRVYNIDTPYIPETRTFLKEQFSSRSVRFSRSMAAISF